jgi:broad specificity phosphatase PhoE
VEDSAEATVIFLVRHALCDSVGTSIAGRKDAVSLNEAGRRQAVMLAERLNAGGCHALYTSPLRRAVETAESIGSRCGLDAVPDDAFTEIDFGAWSGESMAQLSGRSRWRRYNDFRSWTTIPDGELMVAAQARAVAGVSRLRDAHPGKRVIVVTHADVIRGLLAYAVGAPVDLMLRFECDPASVSVVSIGGETVRVLRVNDSGTLSGL